MQAWVPLLVACSGLPAIALAAWLARSPLPLRRGLALRMALVGIAILIGALGLHWAGAETARVRGVAIVLLLAVNALGISMLVHARRHGGDARMSP